MTQKDLLETTKNGLHILSSTSVCDLRKKNETKNKTGVKLVVRNKNKYESKPLIADPRHRRPSEYSSEDQYSEEGDEERGYSVDSSSEDELNEAHSAKRYYR